MQRTLLMTTVLVLAMASPAAAIEGVVLINSAAAAAGGITAGDTAGFPVSLTEPGSYRLASDLTLVDANTNAIEISADDVEIDLNGFSIIGTATCTWTTGTPPTVGCTGTGTGKGIFATSGHFTSVGNGRVRGMGSDGIRILDGGRIENVEVVGNGGEGVIAGLSLLISGTLATQNGISGIVAINGQFIDNRSVRNGNDGIFASADSVFTGNVALENNRNGLWNFFSAGVFRANISNRNGAVGIACASCAVTGNTVNVNQGSGILVTRTSPIINNVVYANTGPGIEISARAAAVLENTVANNVGIGVKFTLGASASGGYGGNLIYSNTGGTVTAAVPELGLNMCESNTTCP